MLMSQKNFLHMFLHFSHLKFWDKFWTTHCINIKEWMEKTPNFFQGCDVVVGMKKDLTDCCHILYTVHILDKFQWHKKEIGLEGFQVCFAANFPVLKKEACDQICPSIRKSVCIQFCQPSALSIIPSATYLLLPTISYYP